MWAIPYSMIRPSLGFFSLSLIANFVNNAGVFFAGAVAGLKSAGDFSLIQKTFGLLITSHLAILSPMGPLYTFHARQGQWDRIRNKLRFCLCRIWPLLFLFGGTVIFLFHPIFIRIWSGRWLSDYFLAALIAGNAVVAGFGNTFSVLLNSLGIVKKQAILAALMVLPFIYLPLMLGRHLGTHGVVLASILCSMPGIFFLPLWVKDAFRKKTLII
jgi:O-antigen/teichoic acid export membrane protein